MLQNQLPRVGEAVVLQVAAAKHANREGPAQGPVVGQAHPGGVAVRVHHRDGQLERRLLLVFGVFIAPLLFGFLLRATCFALFPFPRLVLQILARPRLVVETTDVHLESRLRPHGPFPGQPVGQREGEHRGRGGFVGAPVAVVPPQPERLVELR